MDWTNERYVRVYTRDTPDWLLLSWEARSVFLHLVRKVDRSGLLELGRHGNKGIAAAIGIPLAVVERALPELADDGCIQIAPDHIVIPNFVDAQEARGARNVCRAAQHGLGHRPPRDVGVLERDEWICVYCGAALSIDFSHVDHVVPRSRKGSDDRSNLVAACPPCNLSKGAKTPDEWRGGAR